MTRILCVEDEVDLRDDLVEFLEDEGFEVAAASNGAEGLEKLVSFKPDMIISDCLMPVMSGAEMLAKLRKEHPDFASTRFIFVSAHGEKQQIEKGLEVGADAYLAKPVSYESLLACITGLLEKESAA